ncbi:MAG: DUF2254 family protein [Candidatus Nitrotoga sp.]
MPYLSVNIGVLLVLVSLAVLIFFTRHISQSMQAEFLIAAIGEDFADSLTMLFSSSRYLRGCHEKIAMVGRNLFATAVTGGG